VIGAVVTAGMGAAQIANEIGCSKMQVYQLLKPQASINVN